MAEHGQPDIAGATATAQAGMAQAGMTASGRPGAVVPYEAPPAHHGRPVSWAAVSIILIGFIAGGAALISGPIWWLFWAGCGVAAFGGITALASGILNDWY